MFLRAISTLLMVGYLVLPAVSHAQDGQQIIARIWTDQDNRQVSAIFKAKVDNQVKLEKYNGEIVSLDYDTLIRADQSYVDDIVNRFGTAPGSRTWSDTNGNNFRGMFVGLEKSEIEFILIDEDKKIRLETIFLSEQDVRFVLGELNKNTPSRLSSNRYRIWSYRDANQNRLQSIAKYKHVEGDLVVVSQLDQTFRIRLSRLSEDDLDFIAVADPVAKSAIARFQTQSENEKKSGKEKVEKSAAPPEITPIWWVSLGLIFILMLVLISIKYVYESSEPEWDDEI